MISLYLISSVLHFTCLFFVLGYFLLNENSFGQDLKTKCEVVPSHLQTEYRVQTKSLMRLNVITRVLKYPIGMSRYKVTYELNYTAFVSAVINILYFVNIVLFFFLLFKNRVNC